MRRFFRQFSFPGGVPSHCAPETPGSFHEGGELGYSLLHAFGAALDDPDLVVFCVVGDGEAETGPLATSWHVDEVPQPGARRRGAADPAPQRVQDRQPDAAGPHPRGRPRRPAARLRLRPDRRRRRRSGRRCTRRWPPRSTACLDRIADDPAGPARGGGDRRSDRAVADDRAAHAEGLDVPARSSTASRSRARSEPIRCRFPTCARRPVHRAVLEQWLRVRTGRRSCSRPAGRCAELTALSPTGDRADEREPGRQRRRRCCATCELPDWRDYDVDVPARARSCTRRPGCSARGCATSRPTTPRLPDLRARRAGQQPAAGRPRRHRPRLADARSASATTGSPATAASSRCSPSTCARACSRATCSPAATALFTCYEAFIHIVDSMFNQHAKWLEASAQVPWRRPIASLNYLLSSHVWRQDHNGFTPPGPRLPRRGDEQEARGRARLPAARRQHAAVAPTTTASGRASTSTSWSPASSRSATG